MASPIEQLIEHFLGSSLGLVPSLFLLILAFAVLTKSADIFVDAAVGVAEKVNLPKFLIGIIMVSVGTTLPEFVVSVLSALKGKPEMALGNAVGSVICDDGLALPLAAVFAIGVITVDSYVLRFAAGWLIAIDLTAYLMCAWDGKMSRGEGLVLLAMFVAYVSLALHRERRRPKELDPAVTEHECETKRGMAGLLGLFAFALVGVIIAGDVIVFAASIVATEVGVPDEIIAMSLVALGTSVPEVATCIVAARKGHGAIAAGNILGADILNICWVAGASAVANPLTIDQNTVHFMFPAMLAIVLVMLFFMGVTGRVSRTAGFTLLCMYIVYLTLLFIFFRETTPAGSP